ncbi:MAG: hypothetical protein WDO16_14325 [Bacteroidota bacterium]
MHITANGEFSLEGNITIQQITHAVVKAVTKTGRNILLLLSGINPVYN